MTAKIKTERGVEVESHKSCLNCEFLYFGYEFPCHCNNKRSNHYKHYIINDHPACKSFKEKE